MIANGVLEVRPGVFVKGDLLIAGSGSVYTLTPLSDAGREWVEAHIEVEPWQRIGPGVAVEHRYIGDIAFGAQDDGLVVMAR